MSPDAYDGTAEIAGAKDRSEDNSTTIPERAADPNPKPSKPPVPLTRDFFIGSSPCPQKKRGLNRAYYNPVLPAGNISGGATDAFVYEPRSGPLERPSPVSGDPALLRTNSWCGTSSGAWSGGSDTQLGGIHAHSGDIHTKQRFADGGDSCGQNVPPSAALREQSSQGGSVGSSDGANSPQLVSFPLGSGSVNRPHSAGVPVIRGVPDGSSALAKHPPSRNIDSRRDPPEMYISSAERDTGQPLDALPGTLLRRGSPQNALPETVIRTRHRGGTVSSGEEAVLATDAAEPQAGLDTETERVPWGAQPLEEEFITEFGKRMQHIIQSKEQNEERIKRQTEGGVHADGSPQSKQAKEERMKRHIEGSEIAQGAGSPDGLEESSSPVIDKKLVDFEILRAEHKRLALAPGVPQTPKNILSRDETLYEAVREGESVARSLEASTAPENGETDGAGSEGEGATTVADGAVLEAGKMGSHVTEASVEDVLTRDDASGAEPSSQANVDCSPHPLGRFAAVQQDEDSTANSSAEGRPDDARGRHVTYDYAYEARQRQMEAEISELDQMKERFSKLLLGEDMSGGGKGVSTALAISNAITNLSAAVFGELHKLEPLAPERKCKWRRELEWLLCPTEHIVEMVPAMNHGADGSSHEVMVQRQRADLHASLPALRKLDTMLTECLDSFVEKGFWYLDPGHDSPGDSRPGTASQHQSDRWWLPEAMVPLEGLDERSMRKLENQKGVAKQILKAAMAINAQVLAEMAVPEAYWEMLPKRSQLALGDQRYRILTADQFSPDAVLSTVNVLDEHSALKCANDLEAAIHIWRRKTGKKAGDQDRDRFGNGYSPATDGGTRWSAALSGVMAPMAEKREKNAGRAMDALWNLRLRCPGLSQTTLHVYKIQYNKDVGQAILESYSRVLESLASSILSRIDHVLAVNTAVLEQLSIHKGNEFQSLPATPSSQHSSMDGGPFSGSQTPTSPLKNEPVTYARKMVPVLSESFARKVASQPAMQAKMK